MTDFTAQDVLTFWLVECERSQWFKKDDAFDAVIRLRFGETVDAALDGDLEEWNESRDGLLAKIILLDQFTRNLFRGSAKSFAGDQEALRLSLLGQQRGYLQTMEPDERYFMLMPMMHSEDIAIQNASLPLFAKHTNDEVYGYAVKHRDIVANYGRFPHRNDVLGRPSTSQEKAFLKKPGSSF